jgi:hypothetical protein
LAGSIVVSDQAGAAGDKATVADCLNAADDNAFELQGFSFKTFDRIQQTLGEKPLVVLNEGQLVGEKGDEVERVAPKTKAAAAPS